MTAGSPRIFNPEGAAWYNANVANTYRIVNNKDIVPSLPLKQFGYNFFRIFVPCMITPGMTPYALSFISPQSLLAAWDQDQ